jgi:hypothetical protein
MKALRKVLVLVTVSAIILSVCSCARKADPEIRDNDDPGYSKSEGLPDETTEDTDIVVATTSESETETSAVDTTKEETTTTSEDVKMPTLEDMIPPSLITDTINDMKNTDQFLAYYKDLKLTVEENHITYEYWFNVSMDEDEREAQKETIESSGLLEAIDSTKDMFERDYGIRPSMITFKYYTADNIHVVTIEE